MIVLFAVIVFVILIGGILAGLFGLYVLGIMFKSIFDDVWNDLK